MSQTELTPMLYEQIMIFNSYDPKDMQDNVRVLIDLAFIEGLSQQFQRTKPFVWGFAILSFAGGFLAGAMTMVRIIK